MKSLSPAQDGSGFNYGQKRLYRRKREFWDSQYDATEANKKRINDIYRAIHNGKPKLNKNTTQFYHKKRSRTSRPLKYSVKYGHTSKESLRRPDYHFSSEVIVPPPNGFDVGEEFDVAREAADLADDSYFHKQVKSPKRIHANLKNVQIAGDVTLHQNRAIRQRATPTVDNYDDDSQAGSDEYVDRDSNEGGDDEDYDEDENPNVNTDYEIIETAAPAAGPRPVAPRRPTNPRDPTLAVISGKNGRRIIPRRNLPPPYHPCNENVAIVEHKQTTTSHRESIAKSTKKLHSPEELYAEIAKIIETKRKNYKRPGHDKTHWELKIVPSLQDDNNRK